MISFEDKFCKWSGWDVSGGAGTLLFYVTEWTDYSKTLIKNGGGEVEDYTVFMFDSESGKIYFLTDNGEDEISYDVELFVV